MIMFPVGDNDFYKKCTWNFQVHFKVYCLEKNVGKFPHQNLSFLASNLAFKWDRISDTNIF